MNGSDPFEERLRRQPLQAVPPEWRANILRAARQAAAPAPVSQAPRPSLISNLKSQISDFLWPHPKAWAALGAAWVVVVGFCLGAREPGLPPMAHNFTAPSPQMRALLQEQARLFMELAGPADRPTATRPKPVAPSPRSQREEESLNT